MISSSLLLDSWASARAFLVAYSYNYFAIYSLSFFSASGSNFDTVLVLAAEVEDF